MFRNTRWLVWVLIFCLWLSSSALSPPRATYRVHSIQVKGHKIPLSIWQPTQAAASSTSPASVAASSTSPATYDYAISVPRIAKLLLGLPLPNFPFLCSSYSLEAGPGVVDTGGVGSDIPSRKSSPLVVVSHGFLGSRFDLSPICEALALRGVTAVAPGESVTPMLPFTMSLLLANPPSLVAVEYPESLSASYDVGDSGLERRNVIDALLQSHTGPVGFLGHSLGTGLTLSYPLAGAPRCAVAGFRGVAEACEGCPLLVVASDGDSVCPGLVIRERVAEAEASSNNGGAASIEKVSLDSVSTSFSAARSEETKRCE